MSDNQVLEEKNKAKSFRECFGHMFCRENKCVAWIHYILQQNVIYVTINVKLYVGSSRNKNDSNAEYHKSCDEYIRGRKQQRQPSGPHSHTATAQLSTHAHHPHDRGSARATPTGEKEKGTVFAPL